jgi:hypothetical protein
MKFINQVNILSVAVVSFCWIVLYKLSIPHRKPEIFTLRVPKEEGESHWVFTEKYILRKLIAKKRITITLDGDRQTDFKKIELIRYEARKLNYTLDSTTVLDIHFSSETKYQSIIDLLRMCQYDGQKVYVYMKDRFIIFGCPPDESPKSKTKIEPIHL